MSRRVIPYAIALALTLSVAPAATATSPESSTSDAGQCALVTLVSTDEDEARADVYIAKDHPFPGPPDDPTLEDLRPYLEEVVQSAVDHLTAQPTSGSSDVQVELVFPANGDAQTSGYRVSLIVDLEYCTLP